MVEIRLPPLHPHQAEVAKDPARFRVLACGRRWGKSRLGALLCVATAARGKRAWWVSPSYPMSAIGWREIKRLALQIPGMAVRESDRKIEIGHGYAQVKSSDNPNSLRGEGLDLAVLDECAFMAGDTWTQAIRPALADRQGKAFFISTPKGRNWFWSLYMQSGQNDVKAWSFPTADNPFIVPTEIEAAKRELPELIFRQEFLGEFVDAEGAVFRRIQEAIWGAALEGPEEGRQYIAGVDVAASVDFTVASVIDVEAKRLVYMDRFNRVDYPALEDRLHALYKRWKLSSMTVEVNAIGQPVIDHLAGRGMSIIPFTTTNATKQAAITALQSAFEHGEIGIINDSVLIGELLSFESRRSPSGSFQYSAPEGLHDDCVMSLAIAWYGITNQIELIDDIFASW